MRNFENAEKPSIKRSSCGRTQTSLFAQRQKEGKKRKSLEESSNKHSNLSHLATPLPTPPYRTYETRTLLSSAA
jgi:hypothetical protein